MRNYWLYILTNRYNNVLYTGVTNNLDRRLFEHRNGTGSGFTAKYNLKKLVYAEIFHDINSAIAAEKELKAGPRLNKIKLIEMHNPQWEDLKPA